MKTTINIFALILLHFCSFSQSINIYRGSSLIKTIYGSAGALNEAVENSLSGDSIVLSPHKFSDSRIRINKDLIIQGTQTTTDSTIIEQAGFKSIFFISNKTLTGPEITVRFRDIIVQEARLICRSGGYIPIVMDSMYGAGIKAFANTNVIIIGNSVFKNCQIETGCTSIILTDTGFIGGAAIFSQGKLKIGGNTKFTKNKVSSGYANDICSQNELLIEGNAEFDSGLIGSAIAAQGILEIKENVKIKNNIAYLGGGIYAKNCNVKIGDSVQITGNTSLWGLGGIYSENSIISLNNKSVVAGNFGSGIVMINSSLSINDSVLIASNLSNSNYGAGIYNKGGNININGGQIIGNYYYYDSIPGKGMAIYNDTIAGSPSPTINIANARIFNPTQDFKRTIEVYNETGTNLYSDSTWWGESDTTNLIVNNGTATTTLGSWVVADWSFNKGIAIGSDTTFPIDAYFKLNNGAALPSNMFWMLIGLYNCDNGKFKPDTAKMLSTNFISTQYTSSDSTRLVNILATVDSDSFKITKTITGLSITKTIIYNQSLQYNIYPNPISDFLKIRSSNKSETCKIIIADLSGKVYVQKQVTISDNEFLQNLSLENGFYILSISNQNNSTQYFKFLVNKK